MSEKEKLYKSMRKIGREVAIYATGRALVVDTHKKEIVADVQFPSRDAAVTYYWNKGYE